MVPPRLSCPLPPRASSHDPARGKVSAVRHLASFQFGHYSRFARAPILSPAIAAESGVPPSAWRVLGPVLRSDAPLSGC